MCVGVDIFIFIKYRFRYSRLGMDNLKQQNPNNSNEEKDLIRKYFEVIDSLKIHKCERRYFHRVFENFSGLFQVLLPRHFDFRGNLKILWKHFSQLQFYLNNAFFQSLYQSYSS